MTKNLISKLKKIKLLILDVDGVLTDGSINIDDHGTELKCFDVQDGLGIVLLKKAGLKTAIITARSVPAVDHRAKDLKIDKVFQGAYPKTKAFNEVLKNFKLKAEESCFIGDDLTDLSVLKLAGFAVSVPNGVKEAKKLADYVTKKQGGKGAVREVVELILKAQGKWKKILQSME